MTPSLPLPTAVTVVVVAGRSTHPALPHHSRHRRCRCPTGITVVVVASRSTHPAPPSGRRCWADLHTPRRSVVVVAATIAVTVVAAAHSRHRRCCSQQIYTPHAAQWSSLLGRSAHPTTIAVTVVATAGSVVGGCAQGASPTRRGKRVRLRTASRARHPPRIWGRRRPG
jgi:hypothetical protein